LPQQELNQNYGNRTSKKQFKALKQAGLSLNSLIELNELSHLNVALLRVNLNQEIINVKWWAIALGHPLLKFVLKLSVQFDEMKHW
jgi:hypothetical protein